MIRQKRSSTDYVLTARILLSTSALNDSTNQWEVELDNLLANGSVSDAQRFLNQIVEKNSKSTMTSEARILSARTKLFDAWIRHQGSLLKTLQRMDFSTAPPTETTTQAQLQQRQELEQLICEAASEAHGLLEAMEPFLGARNVWLDSVSTFDDEDHEYHGRLLTNDGALEPKFHSSNESLVQRCNDLFGAWAKAVRAVRGKASAGIPQRANFLLERMEASSSSSLDGNMSNSISVEPTLESYNRVLEAWAYSREHLRGATAERILNRMLGHKTMSIRPNGESHRLVLWAWAQSPHEEPFAFRATGHLMKMLRQLEHSLEENADAYDHTMEPTQEDYIVVMKAWSQSEYVANWKIAGGMCLTKC